MAAVKFAFLAVVGFKSYFAMSKSNSNRNTIRFLDVPCTYQSEFQHIKWCFRMMEKLLIAFLVTLPTSHCIKNNEPSILNVNIIVCLLECGNTSDVAINLTDSCSKINGNKIDKMAKHSLNDNL